MADIIDIRTRRPVRRLRLVQYDDLQVEHARKVEQMTERLMAGHDPRPSDGAA